MKLILLHKEREKEYLRIKKSIVLVNEPDELVEGLSDFLKDVGFNTSYLDTEFKMRSEQVPLWQLLTRALLNPLSIENRMFLDNLTPIKEEA